MTNQLTNRGRRIHRNRINAASLRAAATLALAFTSGLVATPSAEAQHYQILYNFTGDTDGASPVSALVRDASGNLYGTAVLGGSGSGVVFKLDPSGTETVLNTFTGTDGSSPVGGVIRDSSGNLYGTTNSAGTIPQGYGWGTVFKLDPAGAETVLYTFNEFIQDGAYPFAGLVQDEAGNLYGTNSIGGNLGSGTVFKVDTAGTETILYSFSGGTDGLSPYAGLLRDAEGNLYGTTLSGGNLSVCSGLGCGVVFKISPAGQETVLHNFTGTDGANPLGGLVQDSAGNLYGTTYEGGASNLGVVFKLNTAGRLTVLHNFAGGTDGANPTAGLILNSAGYLYGTTALGGSSAACPSGCGTVFGMGPKGTMLVLHRFTGGDGGAYPQGGLLGAGGNLYGTTYAGGASDAGVIFQITP